MPYVYYACLQSHSSVVECLHHSALETLASTMNTMSLGWQAQRRQEVTLLLSWVILRAAHSAWARSHEFFTAMRRIGGHRIHDEPYVEPHDQPHDETMDKTADNAANAAAYGLQFPDTRLQGVPMEDVMLTSPGGRGGFWPGSRNWRS